MRAVLVVVLLGACASGDEGDPPAQGSAGAAGASSADQARARCLAIVHDWCHQDAVCIGELQAWTEAQQEAHADGCMAAEEDRCAGLVATVPAQLEACQGALLAHVCRPDYPPAGAPLPASCRGSFTR